jgi:hypothetical protein
LEHRSRPRVVRRVGGEMGVEGRGLFFLYV